MYGTSPSTIWPLECPKPQAKAILVPDRPPRIVEPGGAESATAPSSGRRYRKPLSKIRWADLRLLLEDSFASWTKHNAPRMGAALAFYALLSLMPLLLVAISVGGLLFGAKAAQSGVMGEVQFVIGEQRARIVQALLEGAQNKAGGVVATVLGTLTLMFGASGVLTELRDALNTIWDVPPRPMTKFQEITSLIKGRLWSVGLVLAVVFLLTASMLISTWISALGALASVLPSHEAVLHILNAGFSLVVVTALFGAIYKVVPDVPIEWPDVILGAGVTSLLFTLGNLILGLYLGKASFSSTYGAAASTIVLAMWVYYSSQVFFLGAEFTKAFAECFGSAPSQSPPLPIVSPGADAPPSTLIVPGQ
jgi:membrane protein